MAIGFDAAVGDSGGENSTYTFDHTVTGTDRLLFVVLAGDGRTWSSETYNAVSLTELVVSTNSYISFLALVAPATGTNTVSAVKGGGEGLGCGGASSYTGVNQSTPYDGLTSSLTGDDDPTVDVTSESGNWVVGMSGFGGGGGADSSVPGAGQTERFDVESTGSMQLTISDEDGDTTVTHNYTRTASSAYGDQLIAAVNVIAAVAAAAGNPWYQYAQENPA